MLVHEKSCLITFFLHIIRPVSETLLSDQFGDQISVVYVLDLSKIFLLASSCLGVGVVGLFVFLALPVQI